MRCTPMSPCSYALLYVKCNSYDAIVTIVTANILIFSPSFNTDTKYAYSTCYGQQDDYTNVLAYFYNHTFLNNVNGEILFF